jgi:hypothetical protein
MEYGSQLEPSCLLNSYAKGIYQDVPKNSGWAEKARTLVGNSDKAMLAISEA